MVCRIRQLVVLEISSTDEGSSEDERLISTCNGKKQFKSGKLRMADSLVVHHVLMVNQPLYTTEGHHAI